MRNRLRELRAQKRWSQADLAEILRVSRQTINAVETERYDPSLPLAFKLARVFHTTIEGVFQDDASAAADLNPQSEKQSQSEQPLRGGLDASTTAPVSGGRTPPVH